MFKDWHTLLACSVVLLFGFVLFYLGTDGFQAYTAETARVNQLITDQPEFPDVVLEDSNGRSYHVSELQGSYVFITFMYTSCGTVCPILEMNMAQVYRAVPERYIGEEIIFLSISFDPERDDPATLDKYKEHFGADGDTWRMARINNQEELEKLLSTFGVIVIPDDSGNFAHNSAFYFVDPQGMLIDVMDYTDVNNAAERVISTLQKEEGEDR
ncbi:protein SCO1/2 [Evansella caseinilytica]|uniref:Protein SCO1/2 n=1 Tax=Evansella caseinilytica TaxID=1503961 RepID=A0A1H3MU15_9BACI|nr:SCO family protein [Evansella caseinilytica]SDY80073.1 protein SCO1/2 [Evansella caseinilytica]